MPDDGGTTIDPVAAIGVDQNHRRRESPPKWMCPQMTLSRLRWRAALDGRFFEIEK